MTCHLQLLVTTATTTEWSLTNTISGPQRREGLLRETEVGSSCGALEGWGSQFPTLFSPSQQGRFFLVGDFPLGDEQCHLRGWDDAGKMKLFFPFLCAVLKFGVFCFFVFFKSCIFSPSQE